MKHTYFLTISFLLSSLFSCAPASQNNDLPVAQTPTVATEGFILNGTTKVAYVLNLEDNYAKVYIPSVDKYAEVNVSTGAYHTYNLVYFANAGCTGEIRAKTFFGIVGKAVVYGGSTNFYRVVAPVAGSFSYQSYATGGVCTASSFTDTNTFSVEVITKPYDFAAIAPLNVQFQ